jgi:hypothetical protein
MQLYIYIYIYIYIYKNPYHKTKQIQFDHNTKHTTLIRKPREKKYQPPQNYNPKFKTYKSNEKIKIKTTNLVITHTTKSTNRIKEQKGKTIAYFIHKPPSKHRGNKKKIELNITNCWDSE